MQLSLLSAISHIRTITSLSKEMHGNYTTFAPEQTSRLIRYYAAERESVTADIGLHIDVYHGNSITRQETLEDTPERSLSSGHQPSSPGEGFARQGQGGKSNLGLGQI